MLRAFTSSSVRRGLHSRRALHPRCVSTATKTGLCADKSCPACGAALPSVLPACPKCRFIARVHEDAPRHAVFGLDGARPFDVDAAAAKAAFRRLQQVVHPDLWSGSDQQDRARDLSSFVNESYKMLLDPIARAEHLLAREGHTLDETDRLDDAVFLADTMEQRFLLEDAESQADADAVRADNQQKMDEIIPQLSTAIHAGKWADAKEMTIRLKYLRNIVRAAEKWPETGSDDH